MQFWRLEHPDYDSDYKDSYINGSLEHSFGLPGVHCEVCDQTWGGSRILPFECPSSLRGHEHLNERWPISLDRHQALQREIQNEFSKVVIVIPELRPGDDFQPCYLDIPSIPRADFIWGCLGSVLVSKRVRDLFDALCIGPVSYSPVILRKIGKSEAQLQPPIPSSGEPEEMIHEVPLLMRTDSIEPYFELVIQPESGYETGAEPISICPGCGRKTFPENSERLVMVETMWKRADIFFLTSTLYIVITDRVHQHCLIWGQPMHSFRRSTLPNNLRIRAARRSKP
jgi:hypothetical protein